MIRRRLRVSSRGSAESGPWWALVTVLVLATGLASAASGAEPERLGRKREARR